MMGFPDPPEEFWDVKVDFLDGPPKVWVGYRLRNYEHSYVISNRDYSMVVYIPHRNVMCMELSNKRKA